MLIRVAPGCYGRDNRPDKGAYWKLCGQRFWSFISGNNDLYVEIIEPLGHRAKERNERFHTVYAQITNKFVRETLLDFVRNDLIDWNKLVEFNSGCAEISRHRA
ncbi:MAG: hypothetical protein HYX87_04595 [Chloroflexi bacterium]|nr:hypothetical protein [Chloroflexota bacterium]